MHSAVHNSYSYQFQDVTGFLYHSAVSWVKELKKHLRCENGYSQSYHALLLHLSLHHRLV